MKTQNNNGKKANNNNNTENTNTKKENTMKTNTNTNTNTAAAKAANIDNTAAACAERVSRYEAKKAAQKAAKERAIKEALKADLEAQKAAAAAVRHEKHVDRINAAAEKATNWTSAKSLRDAVGRQTKAAALAAAAAIYNGTATDAQITFLRAAVMAAAKGTDLELSFNALGLVIPADALAAAVGNNGEIKAAATARMLANEIAAKNGTLLALEAAARKAAKAERHAAQKAAKAAKAAAKKAAKAANTADTAAAPKA